MTKLTREDALLIDEVLTFSQVMDDGLALGALSGDETPLILDHKAIAELSEMFVSLVEIIQRLDNV